jgi:hypothetical protein
VNANVNPNLRRAPARKWGRPAMAAASLSALLLTGCAVFDVLKQRLAIFGTSFSMQNLDVSGLVYPSDWLSASLDLVLPDRSFLGNFGVDVRASIKAKNANAQKAVFDGATAHLRVLDTKSSSPSATGVIPGFTVEPNSATSVGITFPLRLNNPVFTKAAWKAMVKGDDIPYQIDADLKLNLLSPLGVPDSIGARTVNMKVVAGSVDAKAAGGNAVERFLRIIDKAF